MSRRRRMVPPPAKAGADTQSGNPDALRGLNRLETSQNPLKTPKTLIFELSAPKAKVNAAGVDLPRYRQKGFLADGY